METRTQIVPVKLPNNAIIKVEAATLDPEQDVAYDLQSLAEVTDAIEGLAGAVMATCQKLKPREVSVEFGIEVGIESGKLTALWVKGTGKANLKVTLKWEGDASK